ncbi:alpha/beta hydrolase [Roseicitreum antarcticum]|uniref:Pimeloyl-ACP methyl ester carboxylesterase n=1 Tax=Roseicitreum antarcticum TaxID=564137 RepID=A0A1H2UF13_9RHOB|nr:alpha/beta hydrolase [Roseicitreum antarcticum]SDW54109.1 Pimeloyl-ACP methyl ester carboxylesterase [Roseicitreum antarcticum]
MSDHPPPPQRLETPDGRQIAYHKLPATPDQSTRPGVIFLGGFRSDMNGSKALHLEEWARKHGRAFLRFDYSGHGQSSGTFEEGAIGDWFADARAVLSALTAGPQILVGSSMGGWIALLLARSLPDRVAGLIGIAAAPDFTEDSMWATFTTPQRASLMADGQIALPSDYSETPYIITRRLIEDGRDHLVLRTALPLPFPVRLLQGTADTDVVPAAALRLLDHAAGPDIRLTLVQGADHRFSDPACLLLITETIESV